VIHELLMTPQSVQALTNLLKAVRHRSNYNDVLAAVSEVSTKLLQANDIALASQEKLSTFAAKVNDHETEITHLKNWDRERERYELKDIAGGMFVRVEKGCMGDFESAHKFCSTCSEQHFKSPLQQEKVAVGRRLKLICHRCKSSPIFDSYLKNS